MEDCIRPALNQAVISKNSKIKLKFFFLCDLILRYTVKTPKKKKKQEL